MFLELFHSITPDTVVLTPNQQLANSLIKRFEKWQPQQSNASILSIYNWLQLKWQLISSTNIILLSDAQRYVIWEDIVRNSLQGSLLLNAAPTIRTAIDAWTLLNSWQINIEHPQFNDSEDTRVWQHWAKEYILRCNKNRWLDSSTLIDSLLELVKLNQLTIPQRIILLGFNDITPQQSTFFNLLAAKNCHIIHHKLSIPVSQNYRLPLADNQSELRTMARWAKNCLAENDSVTIACVIPKLHELKNQTRQIFTEIFSPENLLPGYQSNYLPFTINASQPLNTYPIINAALQIIALARPHIPITELSSIIRSPFIGGAEQEINARAACDARLRELSAHTISLSEVINIANKISGCNLLVKQLKNFNRLCNKIRHKHTVIDWATQLTAQLNAFNWPGDESLDSIEFQLKEQWQKLLKELTSLEHLTGPLNFYSVLQRLNNLANQYMFQPQLPDRPIQIMSVLEASGMLFDNLWIMGLDDSVWPTKAQANAFIPVKLQRNMNMPHSSAEQEWRFAHNLTSQFLRSSSTVIVSYALQENDRQLRASALIKDIPEIARNKLSLADDFSLIQQIYQSGESEEFIDNQAPAISAAENIKGGTALLKHQAACPFRAFALFRLGATPLAEAISGLPPLERGKLVHGILEQFWQKTKSHHELMLLTEDELNKIVSHIVMNALKQLQKKYAHLFGERFFKIEQRRLINLIYRWIELEKNRTPFTVIATEQRFSFNLGQLAINMQVDRVDKISDDQYMIIDYKTSKISVHDWYGDRPNEPQLPLYCIASIVPINTVAFAQIRTDEVMCRATGDTALSEKDNSTKLLTPEQWLTQKMQWQNALTLLSEEFAQGIAHVNPKDGGQSCEMCHLKILCRIHESQ
jgi:probable DNA repair protein